MYRCLLAWVHLYEIWDLHKSESEISRSLENARSDSSSSKREALLGLLKQIRNKYRLHNNTNVDLHPQQLSGWISSTHYRGELLPFGPVRFLMLTIAPTCCLTTSLKAPIAWKRERAGQKHLKNGMRKHPGHRSSSRRDSDGPCAHRLSPQEVRTDLLRHCTATRLKSATHHWHTPHIWNTSCFGWWRHFYLCFPWSVRTFLFFYYQLTRLKVTININAHKSNCCSAQTQYW